MPSLPATDLSGPAMSPLRRQLRRRSIMDIGLGLVAVGSATFLGDTPHEQLLAAVAVASLATIWYLVRRHQDLDAVRRDRMRRADAMRAHGMSLADWKAGKDLPAWSERKAAQGEAA